MRQYIKHLQLLNDVMQWPWSGFWTQTDSEPIRTIPSSYILYSPWISPNFMWPLSDDSWAFSTYEAPTSIVLFSVSTQNSLPCNFFTDIFPFLLVSRFPNSNSNWDSQSMLPPFVLTPVSSVAAVCNFVRCEILFQEFPVFDPAFLFIVFFNLLMPWLLGRSSSPM